MKVYAIELMETWADAKSGERRKPELADTVRVLAASGHQAVTVAIASAKHKRAQGEIEGETFDEKVVEAAVESVCDCGTVDLYEHI